MERAGIIGTVPTRWPMGVKARLFLFGCLITIALVHAWPDRSEERALIEVGHRLCGAAAKGTPINRGWNRFQVEWTSRLSGDIETLPRTLQDARLKFSEECDVHVSRGSMLPSDNTDYFLELSDGKGGWVLLLLKARSFYPTYGFEVKAVGSGWTISGPRLRQ